MTEPQQQERDFGRAGASDPESFIAQSRWRFAKTMPHIPHEYTARRDAQDEDAFSAFIVHIREYGEIRKYGKSKYVYHVIDGWKYWTMGAPVGGTVIINRARVCVECGEDLYRHGDDYRMGKSIAPICVHCGAENPVAP
jgi:hypothetical protein